MRFAGDVAVVTGGASGIGRATCGRLAAEGCRVAVVDVHEDGAEAAVEELTGAGHEALPVVADVADSSAVRAAVDRVVGRWAAIDVLVNAAAVMTFERVAELDDSDWDRVIGTNLRSAFLCCKYALPHMSDGAIVNVSSVHAFRTTANVAAYAASKGGLEAFSRALAIECQDVRVRVNTVVPGAVDTPLLWSNPMVQSGQEQIDGRVGRPEDVAAAIAFLASRDAAFITGASLVTDGGRLNAL